LNVRASDAEREAAIERLRHAAGEGRLTFEELAGRIEVAAEVHARRTRTGDRRPERVTGDLPAAIVPASSAPAAAPARATRTFGDVRRAEPLRERRPLGDQRPVLMSRAPSSMPG
jgi:uncharacterized protein with PIN domain